MKKLTDILTCVLFFGFTAVMLVLFLVLPHGDFSELEKRALAEPPDTSVDAILSGEFGQQAESYIADHLPGRSFFVGFAGYYDLFSGRQGTKDMLVASGDRLVEKPNGANDAAITRNIAFINGFAKTVGQTVDLMIVPSAGFVVEQSVQGIHPDYTDDQIISDIYGRAEGSVRPVDLVQTFLSQPDPGALYYRTDHHWTSLGAYRAYAAYMTLLGHEFAPLEAFTVTEYAGFYGTTHSRSGLWLTRPDSVELWDAGAKVTVTAYRNSQDTVGVSHDSLFYPQRLEERDMYTVYLDGNQPLVRIHNPEGSGKLLVIRDSYANCLGTMLANTYETVVLVDLRYYKEPVSQLVQTEGFDDILVCYSLYNFLTDSNFPFLR